jgi:enamine deaminase RidA (YjgF/YER057c/UK114 family)
LFFFCAFVLIDSPFKNESCMEGELAMQPGTSNATAPARRLRATRKLPSAEQRLKELGIQLPSPPTPFGSYAEAVRSGGLLFVSGMLPTDGHAAKFIGRVGSEIDVETGRRAARLAALNGLAVAREYLGSLDKITRIVRLGVSLATTEDCREHPKVADGASDLLQEIFGKDKNPSRLINGVASLPFGTPVALELIFEVA